MKINVTGSRSRSNFLPLLLADSFQYGPISRHSLQSLIGSGLLFTMQKDVELTEDDRDRIQEITEDFEKDMEKVMA